MGLLLTTVAGLIAWIVLWALGVSGFDAFLPGVGLVLAAVAVSNVRQSEPVSGRPALMTTVNYPVHRERSKSAERAGLMRRVWVIAAGITVVGLGLWIWAVAIGNDLSGRLSELGSALLAGAVVAFAVLVLQTRLDDQADLQRQRFEKHAEDERRAFEAGLEAQNLRLVVGLQSDLQKVDLSGADLSRSVFNGKDLTKAVFVKTNLRRAAFLYATLVDAKFIHADLTDAVLSFADLKGATFFEANLTNAVFTDLRNDIDDVDFGGAYYRDGNRPTFDGPMPDDIKPRP